MNNLVGWLVSLFIQGKPLASGLGTLKQYSKTKKTKTKIREKRCKGKRKYLAKYSFQIKPGHVSELK